MLVAFLTGLLGSLHCVGMCGPLALALPTGGATGARYYAGRVLYNLGRIVTYAALGGIVSLLGVAAAMFEVQRYFSLALGVLLLFMAIREFGWLGGKRRAQGNLLSRWLIRRMSAHMQRRGTGALFVFGLLNGLLPCGFVYIGLFQASVAAGPLEGMAVMALFGLGTWPVMLSLSLTGKYVMRFLRDRAVYVMPSLMLTVGLWLVLRGMAMGVPYLSPSMEVRESGEVVMHCCEKLEKKENAGKKAALKGQ